MPRATKKLKYDAFDGEIAIKPRSFVVSGSDGTFVDVPLVPGNTPAPNTGVDYHTYVATSTNHPFLPPLNGKKPGVYGKAGAGNGGPDTPESPYYDGLLIDKFNSVTASPGKNAYHYRRIPFMHKIGGSNSIATVGNQILAEEIIRFHLYGKSGDLEKGPHWQSPFSGGMIQFTMFPYGRSAPASGETNSYVAADNFIHARGNLRSTRYYRQPLTFIPSKISDSYPRGYSGGKTGGIARFALFSGSGDNSSNYTKHYFNHRDSKPVFYMLHNKPEVIFDNNVGILNPLAQHGAVMYGNEAYGVTNGTNGGALSSLYNSSGFLQNWMANYIHPALTEVYPPGHEYEGRAKYYMLTDDNPFGPGSSNSGPITPAIHGNNSGYYQSNPDHGYWPVNPYVGTNTVADPNPPLANGSGLANFIESKPIFNGGHQGYDRGNLMAALSLHNQSSPGWNDIGERSGTIIKGMLELY